MSCSTDECDYLDEERNSGYVIYIIAKNGRFMYYTNGEVYHKGKKKWWSYYLSNAYRWHSEMGAWRITNSMRYNNPQVAPRCHFWNK